MQILLLVEAHHLQWKTYLHVLAIDASLRTLMCSNSSFVDLQGSDLGSMILIHFLLFYTLWKLTFFPVHGHVGLIFCFNCILRLFTFLLEDEQDVHQ